MRMPSAYHLRVEIDNARLRLEQRRTDMKRIVEGYSGRTSLQKDHSARRLIENHYHEDTALIVPRMVSGDPRVRVNTPKGGPAKLSALAGEAAVNEWCRQTQHRVFCQRIATDFNLGWGSALLHLTRRSAFDDDDDDPSAWPILARLETGDSWWDPIATSWETKAFSGYSYSVLQDELIERAQREKGWDLNIVRSLPVDAGLDELFRPDNAPRRGEIVLRECWVPGFRLPNAPKYSNGTIFTMGVGAGGSATMPRAPMPFFGPPWGPIYLYDCHYVPGQSLGMSPCEAVQAQVEELNMHADQLSIATARRKRIGLGDKMFESDAQAIKDAPDGTVVLISGMDKNKFMDLELGGATAEQRQSILELRERLNRISGLDDASRGQVTGVTATESSAATASTGIRTGYRAQRFADCDEQALRGVLWYVVHAKSLKVAVDPADVGAPPEMHGSTEVTVRGGPDAGMSFGDYSLSLDRYSMEKMSDALAQQKATEAVSLALQIGTVAPQIASFVDLRLLLKGVGEAYHIPDFEYVIDPDAAAHVGNQQAMQSQADAQPDAQYTASQPPANPSNQGPPKPQVKPKSKAAPSGLQMVGAK